MFNNSNELGKLKHTTNYTCDECGRGKLQLRCRDIEDKVSEYLYCPICGFEKRPEKSKAEGIWKKQVHTKDTIVEEVKSKNSYVKNRK
jgi:ssDNA-binding Zn-finger/Zn-ribbon topoisomerase 1